MKKKWITQIKFSIRNNKRNIEFKFRLFWAFIQIYREIYFLAEGNVLPSKL
jgi:hypothetical protein